MPIISIIVPCYNSAETIYQTLSSIENQEETDFECIVVNDCSIDNSVKIIDKICDRDNRFKLINLESNIGVSEARNKGIHIASGRFISFLDSDDIWHKNFIKTAISIREKNKYPITHSPYLRFKKKDALVSAKLVSPPDIIDYQNIRNKNYLPLLSAVIDREIVGEFRFKDKRPEDYFLWLELIEDRKFFSKSTSVISAFYRVSNNQRSNNKIKSIKRIYNLFKHERNLNKYEALKTTFNWMKNNSFEKSKKFQDIKNFNIDLNLFLDNEIND